MNDEPLVSIVIPTYNRKEKATRLLNSILKSKYPKDKLELIVVDDASTDGTSEELKHTFPQAQIIRNEKEQLLAQSRNIGIANCNGKLVFLIDDDNVVEENAVSELVNAMNRTATLGVAGPMMYYFDAPSRVWCGRVKRSGVTSLTSFPERDLQQVNINRIVESDEFPNAFMVRREVFEKVGLFDEKVFPIHNDEGDFCKRAQRAGFKIGLVPTARICHDTPLPTKKLSGTRRFHVQTPERAFYVARNRVLFHRKYSQLFEFLIFLAVFLPLISAVYLRVILCDSSLPFRRRGNIAQFYLQGIKDGLKFRTGI
jgi:GT2 family glycosyltransferase